METGEPKEKDIVWAKVKGYPWWPGTIRNISYRSIQNSYKGFSKKKIYIVDFIGNKSHGELSKNDIKSFKQNYEEHCKTKNPSLIKSIELAKKLYNEKFSNGIIDIFEEEEKIVSDKKLNIIKEEHIKNEKNEKEKRYNLLNKKRKESKDIKDEEEEKKKEEETEKDKKEEKKNLTNNDIKINININVTNNNQGTVNINSFQNINNNKKIEKGKKRKETKKKDDEDYILEEEEESDDEHENEDMEDSYFNKENLENELMDIKMNKNKTYLIRNEKSNNNNMLKSINIKKKKLIKGTIKEEKGKYNENENFFEDFDLKKERIVKNEELNRIIQNLLNYQIQLSNSQNNKLILSELNNLQNAISDDINIDLNIYYHEIYKVLSTFTYNKNIDIVSKCTEILSNLTHKIIKKFFVLTEEDINLILKEKDELNNFEGQNENEIDEKEFLESKKICDLITNLDNISEELSIRSKKSRTKKSINDYQKTNNEKVNNKKEDSNLSPNKNNNKSLSDNIFDIISNDLSDNFHQISENFFKNIYNKKDNGLDKNLAIKRKHVCIKLFSLFKKAFPKLEEEYLKKIILFTEYKIRIEDPTFGKKYEKEIDNLFYKVRNINNKSKEEK